jgi:hypothetical protein
MGREETYDTAPCLNPLTPYHIPKPPLRVSHGPCMRWHGCDHGAIAA